MRRWVEFWTRSAVNGLRWGKSALDRGLWVAAAAAFLFGVAFVVAPLHHAAPTRKHPFHYHFPTLRFCVSIGAFWLLALGHGAFVTWKKDTDSLSIELTAAKTERDVLLAEKAAPKRLPDAHVAEMKEMIRSVRNEVKAKVAIFYGATGLSDALLYQDAIRTHYPELSRQVDTWDRLRNSWIETEQALVERATREVESLAALGVTKGSDATLLKSIDDSRSPTESDWSEAHYTATTIVFPWRSQFVLELPQGTSSDDLRQSKQAWDTLIREGATWKEKLDATELDARLRLDSHMLDGPLAHGEKQHLVNDTRFCKMCPDEYRKAAQDVTMP
jgi:hypothetical protein